MIPRADIEVRHQVDLAALREPGRETVDYPGWLGTQRDYDPELYDSATWEFASEALTDERSALDEVVAEARDEHEFDELAYQRFDAEAPLIGYLELGVSALCLALNAAGCVTASSCRGHPESPRELPQVLLCCDQARGELLLVLARRTSCGIENFERSGLVIYAASVAELLRLAEAVLESRDRFEALPPGPERLAPGEESWD